MPKQSDIEVMVTIDEEHLPQMQAIAARLVDKGLKVSNTLESIGVISGKAQPSSLDRFRSVSGVIAVELSGSVQIAPPDSDIQ